MPEFRIPNDIIVVRGLLPARWEILGLTRYIYIKSPKIKIKVLTVTQVTIANYQLCHTA